MELSDAALRLIHSGGPAVAAQAEARAVRRLASVDEHGRLTLSSTGADALTQSEKEPAE